MALTRPRYSQIYDTDYKQSVKAATTGDVGNILAGGNMTDTVDNVSLAVLDRILVKDQSDATQNGIYRVITLGTGSNGTWERTLDASTGDRMTSGMTTIVERGDTNANKTFRLTTADPITVGTTELTFVDPFVVTASPAGANTEIQFSDTGGVIGASSDLTFDKATQVLTVNGTTNTDDLTISGNVTGNLIPSANVTYSLGDETHWCESLYVSGSTIYIGGTPLTVSGGTLLVDGQEVQGGGGGDFTTSNSTPGSANYGDLWYDTDTDVLFQYINDGSSNVWVDISTEAIVSESSFGTANVNTLLASWGSNTLSTTGNISAGGVLTNNYYYANGTPFIGGGGGGASTLNDLSDVTISSPSNGQVLKYNGSAWVNGTDATGEGGGGATSGFETQFLLMGA